MATLFATLSYDYFATVVNEAQTFRIHVDWPNLLNLILSVHAACTMVSLKLLVNPDEFEPNGCGGSTSTKVADRINEYLPSDVRVFSAGIMSRRFRSRQACNWRHYYYLIPKRDLPSAFVECNEFVLGCLIGCNTFLSVYLLFSALSFFLDTTRGMSCAEVFSIFLVALLPSDTFDEDLFARTLGDLEGTENFAFFSNSSKVRNFLVQYVYAFINCTWCLDGAIDCLPPQQF